MSDDTSVEAGLNIGPGDLYLGVKWVNAWKMDRQQYNDYRGWELPADENGADEGYLVEYLDGGQSNHDNHKGYISWSPVVVFESAYGIQDYEGAQYPERPEWFKRLVTEKQQLDERIAKLSKHIKAEMDADEESIEFPSHEKLSRMSEQLEAMELYRNILARRIKAFKSDCADPV